MIDKLKTILIGNPLENEKIHGQKYSVLWGLPILASDAISSVAYAGQEVLIVLIPVIGLFSYRYVVFIALAILGLLSILMFSYRQTIENYPNGGGSYIVAKDNLGSLAGITAGAALSVDYILTVAVSVSSGVEQLTSAFTVLKPYSIEICIILVLLLMVGNLRGIKESSRLFGFPTYLFILSILIMIGTGLYKYWAGIPVIPNHVPAGYYGVGSISLFLILRAFSNGCTALTGVEAVSNAIPNFKTPERQHAKRVLLFLTIIIFVLFGGTSLLINIYHPTPGVGQPAVLIQMADQIFGRADLFNSVIFYFITGTLFLILFLAANTAFADFPMLLSVMANDRYVPRQMSKRGDRLSFSNGIIILSAVAILLIVAFQANVNNLIGLYAIGVFISFTLSQSGMFVRWLRKKGPHWVLKAVVNGAGAVVTAITVVIIGISKFGEGAYIVIILLPVLIYLMMKVKKHYTALAIQLHISETEYKDPKITRKKYNNRVIVPISSINKASVRALRYAKTICGNITAFSVVTSDEEEKKLLDNYCKLKNNIPLVIRKSMYRRIVSPLLEYIDSAEYNYQKGDIITVVLPQFHVQKWWHNILHHQTRLFVQRKLLKKKHIAIVTIPFQLHDDDEIISKNTPGKQ
jgi:amino acid transporter